VTGGRIPYNFPQPDLTEQEEIDPALQADLTVSIG
jgi:hypothetical protein